MICFADPSRFITDPDFCYQEFSRREEDRFQVLRIQVITSLLLMLLVNKCYVTGMLASCNHVKMEVCVQSEVHTNVVFTAFGFWI